MIISSVKRVPNYNTGDAANLPILVMECSRDNLGRFEKGAKKTLDNGRDRDEVLA